MKRPKNLYAVNRPDGRIYYYYRNPTLPAGHPDRDTGFGYDQAEAYEAAEQLNQYFAGTRNLVGRVLGSRAPFGEFLAHYRDDVLPNRRHKGVPLSPTTLSEYYRILSHIDQALGHRPFADISQGELAEYLSDLSTAEVYNKYRARLVDIYKHALSEGKAQANLPANILKRDTQATVRQRLDLDGYRATFEQASPAIQTAMEVALNFMQRREDVRQFRYDDEREPGWYYRVVSKTKHVGKAAYLRIDLSMPVAYSARGSQTLKDVIEASRDNNLCPFVVHQRPRRYRKAKNKAHWGQLSPKQLSDGFAAARDASGVYAHLSPSERPTFHELIALGEYLRQEQGWSLKQIQRFRGHTQIKTTLRYLEGHEYTTITVSGAEK